MGQHLGFNDERLLWFRPGSVFIGQHERLFGEMNAELYHPHAFTGIRRTGCHRCPVSSRLDQQDDSRNSDFSGTRNLSGDSPYPEASVIRDVPSAAQRSRSSWLSLATRSNASPALLMRYW